LYFVFYAINGFFQHCNIDLRMGILNFIISGPQLHRWHHSVEIQESNTNYGNNLIVWDLLFRTWFLPGARDVGILGLVNREYPLDFLSQLKTPFVKGLDKNL
jgi:sterol desaturase/sphingolipid hydroxylase (fatty acid hydroxylase superfamily)